MNKDENKKQANVFSNFDHTYTKKKRNFLYLTFTYNGLELKALMCNNCRLIGGGNFNH